MCRSDSKDDSSKAKTSPKGSKDSSSDHKNKVSVRDGKESNNKESNSKEHVSHEPYSHHHGSSGRSRESIKEAVKEVTNGHYDEDKKVAIPAAAAAAAAAVSAAVLEGDKLLPVTKPPLIATPPVVGIAGEGRGVEHLCTACNILRTLTNTPFDFIVTGASFNLW